MNRNKELVISWASLVLSIHVLSAVGRLSFVFMSLFFSFFHDFVSSRFSGPFYVDAWV